MTLKIVRLIASDLTHVKLQVRADWTEHDGYGEWKMDHYFTVDVDMNEMLMGDGAYWYEPQDLLHADPLHWKSIRKKYRKKYREDLKQFKKDMASKHPQLKRKRKDMK